MLADAAVAATNQNHALGQACALLTAVIWGYVIVLLKLCGERISPVALNLLKNAVGLVLFIVTLGFLILLGRESLAPLREHPVGDLCLLLLSGVLGIALADSLFFHALNLIGVGLIAIVDCCYAPFAILFAWLLLGEQLTLFHYLGAGLIVVGVFTVSRHTLPVERTRGQIIGGMLLAALAIALMAFGVVIIKPVLEGFPLLWATTLRLTAGFGLLALFTLLGSNGRRHWTVFRPSTTWRIALPASALGTYVCLILWIAGFKYTYASIAAALNQTSVIFQCILAALILNERFGRRQIAALVLGVSGAAIVTFGGRLVAAMASWRVAWGG